MDNKRANDHRAAINRNLRLAAAMLVDSPLAAYMTKGTLGMLRAMGEGESPLYSISIEINDRAPGGADTSCSFWVSYEGWTTRDDADGNLVIDQKRNVSLNWPCHGSMPPESAAARLALYTLCLQVANEISATIPEELPIVMATRAEREEAERKQLAMEEEARFKSILEDAVDPIRKGMRVGQVREVLRTNIPAVPTGVHVFTRADYGGEAVRGYQLDVSENAVWAYLRRTK